MTLLLDPLKSICCNSLFATLRPWDFLCLDCGLYTTPKYGKLWYGKEDSGWNYGYEEPEELKPLEELVGWGWEKLNDDDFKGVLSKCHQKPVKVTKNIPQKTFCSKCGK